MKFIHVLCFSLLCASIGFAGGYIIRAVQTDDSLNWKFEVKL